MLFVEFPSIRTLEPEKNLLARTLPSTFMASAPVLDMKILSPIDNICVGDVFEIPTFEP